MELRGDPGSMVVFQDVTKIYQGRKTLFSKEEEDVVALDRVSFEIRVGEIFALVGESGSGKTTCGRLLVRLEKTTGGLILFEGKRIDILGRSEMKAFRRRVQMIFQDPYQSLNPQLTVFETVVEPLLIHGYGSHGQREEKVQSILEEVGLKPAADFLFRYPHQLSGGQRQRVAVARAMVMEPEFVVADEPVSMLDASVQAQILNMILDLKERYSLTLLFITHDLASARYVSDRLAVIYRGKIMEYGPTEAVIQKPLHPYTRLLIRAAPSARSRTEIRPMAACPVDLYHAPTHKGCRFAARCPHCTPRCREMEAELFHVEAGHYAACFMHYG